LERVKFAVIGLGWFGQKHCEVLSDLSHVELYALCTRNESRLKELGERFHVKHLYTDYHQLLNNNEIDAVSVVTMWDQHLQPTLASLEAGKHVFLEKPMASTVADAEKIVAATKKTSKFFMVGHICRFNPRYASAKVAIDEGRIGKIVSIYARRNIPETVGATVLPKIGPIIGDGVHDTDLMLWYTRANIKSVYAQSLSVRNFPHPDLAWTLFRFDSGAIGVCENVWFLPEKTAFQIDERMEIIGTQGSIHIQETHPNFSICDQNGWHSSDTTYWPLLYGVRSGALREELSYFATCILENEKPTIIHPEESLEAVRACLAAEESAKKGQVIVL
jgi:UDP-N-acetylglucosamine 3-dehydrogenase